MASNDPPILRDKYAALVATIRDGLGPKVSPEVGDFLTGLATLLARDGIMNNGTAFLIESNVVAARLRRKQAEAEAIAAKAARGVAAKVATT